jgi:hypothetical protein
MIDSVASFILLEVTIRRTSACLHSHMTMDENKCLLTGDEGPTRFETTVGLRSPFIANGTYNFPFVARHSAPFLKLWEEEFLMPHGNHLDTSPPGPRRNGCHMKRNSKFTPGTLIYSVGNTLQWVPWPKRVPASNNPPPRQRLTGRLPVYHIHTISSLSLQRGCSQTLTQELHISWK